MSMAAEADDGHVAAAFELFTKSTINAMNAGLTSNANERLEVRPRVQAGGVRCRGRLPRAPPPPLRALVCAQRTHPLPAHACPRTRSQVNATQDVESRICERLHIGGHISYRRLLEDLAGFGYSSNQARARRVVRACWRETRGGVGGGGGRARHIHQHAPLGSHHCLLSLCLPPPSRNTNRLAWR
jgi:hypothetical protein